MTSPQWIAQDGVVTRATTMPSVWQAVQGRWRVRTITARPWDGTPGGREYAILLISLGVLLWLLPLVNVVYLLSAAALIYTIGESSWPQPYRLLAVLMVFGVVLCLRFAYVDPHVYGWARGMEAYFLLRGLDFVLSQRSDHQGLSVAGRRTRFLLWLFFFPTLFVGPMTSYNDFYRSYQPHIRNHRQLVLPVLGRIVWGIAKVSVAIRGLWVLHDTLLASAMVEGLQSGWPLLEQVPPRVLVWGDFGLCLIGFYMVFSGYIDIALALSRWLGFNLPENFDRPLLSTSPVQFWQRSNISIYRWLMIYVFFRFWDHHRLTAKAGSTFMVSGLWHLLMLRAVTWDAVLHVGLAFAIFGASIGVCMKLSHAWTRRQSTWTRRPPWVHWLCWGGKVALNFTFLSLVHGLYFGGVQGKPLADTLAPYRLLFFGAP